MTPPPELLALLQAYVATTGLQVSLSYERQRALSEIHSRGITPEEIRGVLGELQRLIRSGAKGYGDTSLDWRNAIAQVDTLEERVLRLRQRAMRKGITPKPIQVERTVAEGVVVRMIGEEPPRDPQLIGSLINLKSTIRNS